MWKKFILTLLLFSTGGILPFGAAYGLDISDPGDVYPNLQKFYINTKTAGSDFGVATDITVKSYGTLDFSNYSPVMKGLFTSTSTLRITNVGENGVSFTLVGDMGGIWADDGSKVIYTTESGTAFELSGGYGNGTLINGSSTESQNTLLYGTYSPSYWGRQTVKFVDSEGKETGEVINASTQGQTLTIGCTNATQTVTFETDSMLCPYIFKKDCGGQQYDEIHVTGDVVLADGYYIQPEFGEAVYNELRQGIDNTTNEDVVFFRATGKLSNTGVNRQQYAWGDASSDSFAKTYAYGDPEGFSSPVLYKVNYDDENGTISLSKQFSWSGNYMKQMNVTGEKIGNNIYETAYLFNEFLFRGTETEKDESGNSCYVYLSDMALLREVASSTPTEAARLMRQFTPELYGTFTTLQTLNAVKQADNALEQMSNGRQYNGLRNRLGRCGDGDAQVSEKREHYDPFFAQFEGMQDWYAWATPNGQWLSRKTDSLISGNFGYSYDEYGINIGIARNLGSVSLGVSVGWQNGDFSGRDTFHEIESDSFEVMLLGAWYCNNWWADGWFGYHHNINDSQREFKDLWTATSSLAGVDYNVQGWTSGFNIGYQWDFGFCSLSPSAGFHFGNAHQEELWEKESMIKIAAGNTGVYEVPLGLRLSKCIQSTSGWVFVPMLKGEWIARFGHDEMDLITTYYGYTTKHSDTIPESGGYVLYLEGAEMPSEAHINAKVNAMKERFTLGIEYDGSYAENYNVQRVGGTVGFVF